MSDIQKNKSNNPTIQAEQSHWDFIPVNYQFIQDEVKTMAPENVLETLVILKAIEAKHYTSKASEYFLSGYPLRIVNDKIIHNAKSYTVLEFLKVIQEGCFNQETYQEVLKKIITIWDNHSF